MIGMNRHTGEPITDLKAHIRQSIRDVLTTLVGTRIERRDYGSILPLLIDQPMSDALMLRCYTAAIIAIRTWETRVTIRRVVRVVDSKAPGSASLSFDIDTPDGSDRLVVPLRVAA